MCCICILQCMYMYLHRDEICGTINFACWRLRYVVRISRKQGVRLIGVANKNAVLWHAWALPNDLKHNGASFSTILTVWLCLRVAQVPKSRDLAILCWQTDKQTDRQNRLLYPLLRTRTRGKDHCRLYVFMYRGISTIQLMLQALLLCNMHH